MTKHFIIPDVQIRPGDDTTFLTNIGKYIAYKKPDVVVCLGDFADMPSLSSYDVGKKQFEGRRYVKDIEATRKAMDALLAPIEEQYQSAKKSKHKTYWPSLIMTLGNHEHRIQRAVDTDPKLEGVLSINDLGYHEKWDVYPFLDVVVNNGIAYSHYFSTGVLGRPASSAAAQLNKKHMSCVAGHQQGLQIHMSQRADGKRLTSVIAGSCYEHDEDYLGPQANKHWRGCLMLHNVNEGEFDIMPVSLDYLKNKYAP